MKAKFVQYYVAIAIVSGLMLIFTIDRSSVNVFPYDQDQKISFKTYHENVDSAYSQSSTVLAQGGEATRLAFKYTLSKNPSILEPFAALFFFRDDSTTPFFDFSAYNSIAVNLSSFRGKRVPITFTLNYKGFTDKEKLLSNLPLTFLLEYDAPGEYIIPLDKFEIPSWWLREHNLVKEDLTEIDFKRVNYIVVGSCQLLERGVEDTVEIKEIRIYNDNFANYLTTLGVLLVVGILFIILALIRKKKVVVPYSKLNIKQSYDGAPTKTEAVVNYVAKHYMNPELSINDIQNAIGISSREIGNIFKNEFGSSFKKYLNLVRLTEVKRLLLETEEPISVIAYNTGYSNVSHFNRVFKSEEGASPKNFRDREKNG